MQPAKIMIPTIGFNHNNNSSFVGAFTCSPHDDAKDASRMQNTAPKEEVKKADEEAKKLLLFDGVQRVGKIAVLMLLRDNAKYCEEYLFKRFELMETTYDVQFEYFFLENNSKDATNAVIKTFLERRNLSSSRHLIALDLPEFVNTGINFERTSRMAYLRNHLVDSILPVEAPWCLLIDSDIYFDVHMLARMFALEPKKHDVGLLGPFAREGIMGEKARKMGGPDGQFANCKDGDMLVTSHYYDTFAFVDKDSQNFWPRCPFDTCGFCPHKVTPNPGGKLLYVTSCYGGFALVDSEVFNLHRKEVRWDTINISSKVSLCEHVLFNVRLAAATGKKVAIAGGVDQVFWAQ